MIVSLNFVKMTLRFEKEYRCLKWTFECEMDFLEIELKRSSGWKVHRDRNKIQVYVRKPNKFDVQVLKKYVEIYIRPEDRIAFPQQQDEMVIANFTITFDFSSVMDLETRYN